MQHVHAKRKILYRPVGILFNLPCPIGYSSLSSSRTRGSPLRSRAPGRRATQQRHRLEWQNRKLIILMPAGSFLRPSIISPSRTPLAVKKYGCVHPPSRVCPISSFFHPCPSSLVCRRAKRRRRKRKKREIKKFLAAENRARNIKAKRTLSDRSPFRRFMDKLRNGVFASRAWKHIYW